MARTRRASSPIVRSFNRQVSTSSHASSSARHGGYLRARGTRAPLVSVRARLSSLLFAVASSRFILSRAEASNHSLARSMSHATSSARLSGRRNSRARIAERLLSVARGPSPPAPPSRSANSTPMPPQPSPPGWTQRIVTLNPKSRGIYLWTNTLYETLPEIRDVKAGVVNLFLRSTTSAITVNENADPDVRVDLRAALEAIVPDDDRAAPVSSASPWTFQSKEADSPSARGRASTSSPPNPVPSSSSPPSRLAPTFEPRATLP